MKQFKQEKTYTYTDAAGHSSLGQLTPNILSGQSFEGGMSENEKKYRVQMAEEHMKEVLEWLGYDVDIDPNMKETPHRYIKVLAQEICKGTYDPCPKMKSFENQQNYGGIIFEGNIGVKGICSHHLLPIVGKAYVAVIPGDSVLGLSKYNRLVSWICNRPQLQEQMTVQIVNELNKRIPGNKGIAVLIEAAHECVRLRGIEDPDSITTTCKLTGAFLDNKDQARTEFYNMVAQAKFRN